MEINAYLKRNPIMYYVNKERKEDTMKRHGRIT